MHKTCLSFQYGADVIQLSCMVSNNKSVFFSPLFCKCVNKLLRRDGKKTNWPVSMSNLEDQDELMDTSHLAKSGIIIKMSHNVHCPC